MMCRRVGLDSRKGGAVKRLRRLLVVEPLRLEEEGSVASWAVNVFAKGKWKTAGLPSVTGWTKAKIGRWANRPR